LGYINFKIRIILENLKDIMHNKNVKEYNNNTYVFIIKSWHGGHVYHLGDGDKEDHGLRPALAKS
jgi:predicted HNH restriction endonuclease